MNSVLRSAGWAGAFGIAAVTGIGLLAVNPALGQAKPAKTLKLPTNLVIYRGDSAQSAGVSLANWGSGAIDEDTGKILNGTESLKITTHGLYQGASMTFAKPVDLGSLLPNKSNYLTIAVFPPSAGGPETSLPGGSGFPGGSSFPGYGKGGYPGSGGSSGGPGGPGLGGPGRGGYGGYPGAGGSGGGGQVQLQKNRKLENLRLVLVTTGGKTLEAMLPLANAAEDNQWKLLAVPLSQIHGLGADDGQIKEMRIFGDAPATLNIGSISVVEDSTPITLEPINDKTVQRLAKYQYVASANAGVTPLVYTWDWDASDGIQDEAQGRGPTHVFRKASVDDSGKSSDTVVTVTVSDLHGIKAPVKTTFKVHVTP